MPNVRVRKVRPRNDILTVVSTRTVFWWAWTNILNLLLLTLALVVAILIVVAIVFDPNSSLAQSGSSRLPKLLGVFFGSGGLGAALKYLQSQQEKFIAVQEALRASYDLPAKEKEKVIAACLSKMK
jgi:hypothetical protein